MASVWRSYDEFDIMCEKGHDSDGELVARSHRINAAIQSRHPQSVVSQTNLGNPAKWVAKEEARNEPKSDTCLLTVMSDLSRSGAMHPYHRH